jgi:hypothetical protein
VYQPWYDTLTGALRLAWVTGLPPAYD